MGSDGNKDELGAFAPSYEMAILPSANASATCSRDSIFKLWSLLSTDAHLKLQGATHVFVFNLLLDAPMCDPSHAQLSSKHLHVCKTEI